MGSRASQLRNRQQIQDSSATVAPAENCCNANADTLVSKHDVLSSSTKDINDFENNNNHVDVAVDMTKIKATLNQIGTQILQENGLASNDTQQQLQAQLEPNGNSNGARPTSSSQPSKVSTLQRQASHIQSLAQRIRRSSSLRAPKLRALIPSFVTGKRKASTDVSTPQQQASLNEDALSAEQVVSSPQEPEQVPKDSPTVENQADATAPEVASVVEQPKSDEPQALKEGVKEPEQTVPTNEEPKQADAPAQEQSVQETQATKADETKSESIVEEVKNQEQAEVKETSPSETAAATPVQGEELAQASVDAIPASNETPVPESGNKVDQQAPESDELAPDQSVSESQQVSQDAPPIENQADTTAPEAASAVEQPKSDEPQALKEGVKEPEQTVPSSEEPKQADVQGAPQSESEKPSDEAAKDASAAEQQKSDEPSEVVKEPEQPVAKSEEPQQADVPAQEQSVQETQGDDAKSESVVEEVKNQEQAEVKETSPSETAAATPVQGGELAQASVDAIPASNETPVPESEKKVDGEAAEAVSDKPTEPTNELSNAEAQ